MIDTNFIIQKYVNLCLDRLASKIVIILQGYVPIDTRELQNAIEAYRQSNDQLVFGVVNKTLNYSQKKQNEKKLPFYVAEDLNSWVLANILNLGVSSPKKSEGAFKKSGVRELKRTRNNLFGKRKSPTANWWDDAMKLIEITINEEINIIYQDMSKELFEAVLLNSGWQRK